MRLEIPFTKGGLILNAREHTLYQPFRVEGFHGELAKSSENQERVLNE